jgi:hypothetical protein
MSGVTTEQTTADALRPMRADASRNRVRLVEAARAVYREDVDELVGHAGEEGDATDAWQGLVAWLDAFVRYAQAKRTFLTELHEAFEKSPDLAVESREKIARAAGTVLRRAQDAGVARSDVGQDDLMQLVGGMCMARNATLEQNQRLLTFVLDGIRAQP